ncbi:MAG: OsmC family protein [Gemmatimonadetes bacterium]|nr:MAG: OsmC family protein [Gemmatimonadota bacterium]
MSNVEVKWMEGLQFLAQTGSGHGIVLDGPDGAGARPLEMLLVGLAGCTAMDVISILQKKRQHVTDFRVSVSGKRAENHPKIYTDIHIEYHITGKEISEKAVERAIELSETAYCSASAMLGKAATITSSYQISEAE